MRNSYLLAAGILAAVVLWLLTGLFKSGRADSSPEAGAAPDAPRKTATAPMTVKAATVEAAPYAADITIQGRTEAVRIVAVKSETDGRVESVPVEKGDRVKAGDVICRLAVDERKARLDEARALAAQRKLEYDAAVELAKKGYRAPTQVAANKAQYDAARAMVAQMDIQLAHTEIRAPFGGVVNDRPVHVGDYLQKGGTCATVLDLDPFLVVGEVSERMVGQIRPGQKGIARLVDGGMAAGRIRYVASSAQPETRTFRIELAVPNPDLAFRDGVTAEIRLPVAAAVAHFVPSSALVLNDAGQLGVRIVNNGLVRFRPVAILGDDGKGVWVRGLEGTETVITIGQDFVTDGTRVKVDLVKPAAATQAPMTPAPATKG